MPLPMTQPKLTPIPSFSLYGLSEHGQIWRLAPCTRGRYADRPPAPMKPQIHPRGLQWGVTLIRDDGKRVRLSLRKAWRLTFGDEKDCPVS